MRTNKTIQATLNEISRRSIKYNNAPDEQRRYLRRLLRFTIRNTDESEQVFLMRYILEQIHYKNIATDEETIALVTNASIKRYISIFVLGIGFLAVTYFLFVDDTFIRSIIEKLTNLASILRVK